MNMLQCGQSERIYIFLINGASWFLKPNLLTEAITIKKDFSIWGPGVSWEISKAPQGSLLKKF